jgi:hypothetical protein
MLPAISLRMPFANYSPTQHSCRFSTANRDSARASVVVFGPPFDSEPAGCTMTNAIFVRLNMKKAGILDSGLVDLKWLRGAAMHRNCHLGRAFSLLPRRRLGLTNAADQPTKSKEHSRFPSFGRGSDSHRPLHKSR